MNILSKSFLTSTTFWGIVVSILSQVAKHYGYTLDTDGLTNELVSAAGLGLAMYGRFTAIQPLHVVTQTSTPVSIAPAVPPEPVPKVAPAVLTVTPVVEKIVAAVEALKP